MPLEGLDFEVADGTYEGRFVTPPDGDADRCVIVLPGAGHGPFGDIFDIAMYELASAGVASFRYESWETTEDIDAKTLDGLHDELDAAVALARDRGYDDLALLAKSFGGRVAFTHDLDAFSRVLGWAPAVALADESNLDAVHDTPMGEFESLQIAASDLVAFDGPIRLLYGDDDHFHPEASEPLAAALDAGLRILEGENHSFNAQRRTVVAETLAFLADEPDPRAD